MSIQECDLLLQLRCRWIYSTSFAGGGMIRQIRPICRRQKLYTTQDILGSDALSWYDDICKGKMPAARTGVSTKEEGI